MTLDETWKVVIFLTTLMIHWKNYFFVSSINTKKNIFICLCSLVSAIHDSRRDTESSDFFNNTYDSLKNYFFVSSINTKKKYFYLFVFTRECYT